MKKFQKYTVSGAEEESQVEHELSEYLFTFSHFPADIFDIPNHSDNQKLIVFYFGLNKTTNDRSNRARQLLTSTCKWDYWLGDVKLKHKKKYIC